MTKSKDREGAGTVVGGSTAGFDADPDSKRVRCGRCNQLVVQGDFCVNCGYYIKGVVTEISASLPSILVDGRPAVVEPPPPSAPLPSVIPASIPLQSVPATSPGWPSIVSPAPQAPPKVPASKGKAPPNVGASTIVQFKEDPFKWILLTVCLLVLALFAISFFATWYKAYQKDHPSVPSSSPSSR